jgi:glutamate racemase
MIGVFDSGLGGLTVFKEILKKLPNYDYLYLGDNARVPYGEKPKEVIYKYTCQAVDFLFAQKCELIIIACNTASAEALRKIQQEYLPKKYPSKRVLGVIRPLAEDIAKNKNLKRVGVIGTNATISSNVYPIEINHLNKKIKVYTQATPLLVPLIEGGHVNHLETNIILKEYLKPLQNKKIENLILGCTHYPFLRAKIAKIMGKHCALPKTGEIIALSLADYLKRHPELNIKSVAKPKQQFFTTASPKKFKTLGEKFFGHEINHIKKITL